MYKLIRFFAVIFLFVIATALIVSIWWLLDSPDLTNRLSVTSQILQKNANATARRNIEIAREILEDPDSDFIQLKIADSDLSHSAYLTSKEIQIKIVEMQAQLHRRMAELKEQQAEELREQTP